MSRFDPTPAQAFGEFLMGVATLIGYGAFFVFVFGLLF